MERALKMILQRFCKTRAFCKAPKVIVVLCSYSLILSSFPIAHISQIILNPPMSLLTVVDLAKKFRRVALSHQVELVDVTVSDNNDSMIRTRTSAAAYEDEDNNSNRRQQRQ